MDAIVVYESVYGNTREVADSIGEGVRADAVLPVHEAQGRQGTADLLIVGGPTHLHGLANRVFGRGSTIFRLPQRTMPRRSIHAWTSPRGSAARRHAVSRDACVASAST